MTRAVDAIPAAEGLPEKKVELMRIAYRLMAQKGMHRTTLQDVAEAAGLSKATVVYYFRTKEDLVLIDCSDFIDEGTKLVRSIKRGCAISS